MASEDFLKKYINLIAELGEKLQSDAWWTSWIPAKNRHANLFLAKIEEVFLGALPESLSRKSQMGQWISHLWRTLRLNNVLLKQSIFAYFSLRKNFKVFSTVAKNNPVYLLKTFGFKQCFQKDHFRDVYFGPLPEHLKNKRHFKTLSLVHVLSDFRKSVKSMQNYDGVLPFQFFLRPIDFFYIWIKIGKSFFKKIPKEVFLDGKNIAPLLKQQFQRDKVDENAFFSWAMYFALKRILKSFDVSHFLLTHENNPWERMCILAVKRTSPQTKIIGYQHSVVSQAGINMFPGKNERSYAPLPDAILTVGEETVEILKRYGSFESLPIQPSCSLRYEYLEKTEFLSHLSQEKILLIALEATLETTMMLEYAIKHLPLESGWKILVRAHPIYPLSMIEKNSNLNLSSIQNIEISNQTDVLADLKRARVVLYWGTTVALEALLLGRPVIHFDYEKLLSNDPLFNLTDYKWTVSANVPFINILNEIESLTEEKRNQLKEKARNYIRRYFHPITPQNMDRFIL